MHQLLPLFRDLSFLKGVGPSLRKYLEKLVGHTVWDLIKHLPSGIIHRNFVMDLRRAKSKDQIVAIVQVQGYEQKSPKLPLTVVCTVGDQILNITFFKTYPSSIATRLPIGSARLVVGQIELFRGQWQMGHPYFIGNPDEKDQWVGVSPIYPGTQTLSQKMISKFIAQGINMTPNLPEWLSQDLVARHKWLPWKQCLTKCHAPESEGDLLPTNPARQRLAFDELLAYQLALKMIRHENKSPVLIDPLQTHQAILDRAVQTMGFELTPDQVRAFDEILKDMTSGHLMTRLVQGDVGSGKTAVAFLALVLAAANGRQGAIMVPTEILAKQHFKTLKPWAEALGISLDILTGKDSAPRKREVQENLENGSLSLVIGTHALIQNDVSFKSLSLVVVDEQHRFGVDQRRTLAQKGQGVHQLFMSATPIPRSLMMTIYGDLDVSYLKSKPAGRKEIQTTLISLKRMPEVIQGIDRALKSGEKIYWICPLVEESELSDLAAAQERHAFLQGYWGDQVGLIHGRMKPAEKEGVMQDFVEGKLRVLVSTTVIEVGVNVVDATIMLIEHAERFGLAQLHQLRGRIGRGDKEGHCLLLYDYALSPNSKARLAVMRETTDGFKIAEEDWHLRGGGDILGSRQSGLPDFKFADLLEHKDLLREATFMAQDIVAQDPNLEKPQHQNLKILMTLYGHKDSKNYAQTG